MAEIKIAADSGGGSVGLVGPASTTSNAAVQFKLPVADGSANQHLKTDGSGQLGWVTEAVGGKILQVVGTTLSSKIAQTTSGSTHYTILSANITPASTSSKIVIMASIPGSYDGNYDGIGILLKRTVSSTTTELGLGDQDSTASRFIATWGPENGSQGRVSTPSIHYLDSPNTTSSTTYTIAAQDGNADDGTFFVNRAHNYSANNSYTVLSSQMIIMEVSS